MTQFFTPIPCADTPLWQTYRLLLRYSIFQPRVNSSWSTGIVSEISLPVPASYLRVLFCSWITLSCLLFEPQSTPKPLNCTRNPCWWDEGGVLQCLPYFYIIGFSKCATTDMYRNLAQHPSILQMAMKEPHWFDYLRFIGDECKLTLYASLFVFQSSPFPPCGVGV